MVEVSVVIPTFNRLRLLAECVASVRGQTHPVREIIVVDDGSTDHTNSWCRKQWDIILLETKNAGPSFARNLGARHARGEWIAFLDSDDVWLPDHIETLLAIVEKKSSIQWVLANAIITDANLVPFDGLQGFALAFPAFKKSLTHFRSLFPDHENAGYWHGSGQKQALSGNWLQPSGLVIQTELFRAVGGFDVRYRRCEDMDLLLRLTKVSLATICFRQTYLWRQGQADSLAGDRSALLLKQGALTVLSRSGFSLANQSSLLMIHWTSSFLRHLCDFIIANLLRSLKRAEEIPLIQAGIQTTVACLNIITPLVIARFFSQSAFAEYRIFGMYLASSSALSFTAGFWSLLPYWRTHGALAPAFATLAFKLTSIFAIFFAMLVYLMTPLHEAAAPTFKNAILALSIAAMLPAFYLEQSLAYIGKGLHASVIVATTEVGKVTCLLLSAIYFQNIEIILATILIFMLLRLAILWFVNKKLELIRHESLHLLNVEQILKPAFPICLSAALLTLAGNLDRFYLNHQLSGTNFAIVAAGFISFPFVGFFEQTIFQRALPSISALMNENRINDAFIELISAVRKISDVALPITFFFYLFSAQIISILYDDRYERAADIFRICSFLNLTACLPIDILSRARGHSLEILVFALIQLAIVTLAVVIGYSLGGTTFAISSSIFSMLVCRLIFLAWKFHSLKISIARFLFSSFNIQRNLSVLLALFLLSKFMTILHP